MAKTITRIGLLQPIHVRFRKGKYEIIQGERRWRASKLAGLKKIPVIIKDIDDERMMVESLVENVQRVDLLPIEKGQGLAAIYRQRGYDPLKIAGKLQTIYHKIKGYGTYKPETQLTEEERRLREIADMVGLSYFYQYLLLTQLRLSQDEQERVTELELGSDKISTIATIEEPEIRERVIEIAPELKRDEVSKLSKVIRKGSKNLVKAVLKPKSRITPTIAEQIIELPISKQTEAIESVEVLRLDDDEAIARIESIRRDEGLETLEPPQTLDVPLQEQYQQQRLWNLSQLIGADYTQRKRSFYFDIITVGFSQKSLDGLMEALEAAKVEMLVDVRRNPVSQYRPEFNKNILAKRLKKEGIDYHHIPELGIPRELRNKALTGKMTAEQLFDLYEKEILTHSALSKLENTIAGKKVVALLCTEVSPTLCHRHRIANALKKRGKICYDI